MSPYHGGDLLAFKDSTIHPYKMTYMTLFLGEGLGKRKVTFNFFVISCMNDLSGIQGRFLLEKLDAVAFSVHLKIKCHTEKGKPIVNNANIKEASRIK